MLIFYINRAGENLPASRLKVLENAKKLLHERIVAAKDGEKEMTIRGFIGTERHRTMWTPIVRRSEKIEGRIGMPDKSTTERAKEDLREGKSPSTAAGEFVHEEIEHIREGKHGARSPQQVIAIGLSKARRAGVPLKPPTKGEAKESTRENAERANERGQSHTAEDPFPRASRAREKVLEREPHSTASHRSLSAQWRTASRHRSRGERHGAAMKAVQT
jgi:hypothetical protein